MGMPVSEVALEHVLSVLKPIWQDKAETASRVRGRIESVLDFAGVRGWRDGENPARWRGHLAHLLPKRQKLSRGHLAAMPYRDVPQFMASLREQAGIAAMALEFTVLTACRTGEVLGCRWNEIDFDRKIWTIPASRMKAGREHRVPLGEPASAILQQLAAAKVGEHVFFGNKGNPLSGAAMLATLKRLGHTCTVHGFRSSFRDWCGNETSFPREIAEGCLAHVAGDSTEPAYRRSDALEKRRALMESWANYCGQEPGANVVPLRA